MLVWSPCCPRDSQESSSAPQFISINSLALSLLYGPTLTLYMNAGKTIALTIQTFDSKAVSLLFNTLSTFVIVFLPRSKHLLISWLQSAIHSDFGAQENKICHYFHFFPIYLPWSDGTGCHEIKRCLLLGRKAMTNLDSILRSRDITLPTKVHLVKAMVFPVVMYGCESWTIKKAEHWRTDAFELRY